VTAFEDLNLKDVLDTAKRNEAEMERAKLELDRLDYDLKTGLESVDRDYKAAAESITALDLPSAVEAKRLKDAAAASERGKQALRSSYAVKAKAKKAEIAEIQKRIDKYDQRLMEQAKKQQELLNNERRVYELDKKKQTAFYESRIAEIKTARAQDVAKLQRQKDELAASITSRYNPTFADDRSASLLSGWNAPTDLPPQADFNAYIESSGIAAAGSGETLSRSLSDFLFLSSRLRSIPYLNSVPPALSRMETEARESIALYSEALSRAGTALKERDTRIAELSAQIAVAERALDSYRWAIVEYLRRSREGGYILDPRDRSGVTVALNPGVPVSKGSIAYVVRGDKVVAKVSIFLQDGAPRARVVELADGETIRPFDALLVEASPEVAK
jgi:hypothetical protein